MKPGVLYWLPYSLDGFLQINNLGEIRDTRTDTAQHPVFSDPVFAAARQDSVEARANRIREIAKQILAEQERDKGRDMER